MEQKVCQADPKFSEKDIKWFVATDSNEVKTYAKKNYPSKVRTLDIKLEHIALKQPSAQGLLGVLLDNFLLSESDFIIMSMSSFSKTALGLSFLSLGQHSTYGKKCSSSQQAMPSTRPGATNFTMWSKFIVVKKACPTNSIESIYTLHGTEKKEFRIAKNIYFCPACE